MGTWTTLATDVQQWTMNELVTSTVIYNTILPNVEEELSRMIVVDAFNVTTSGTLTANSQTLATPTNLIAPRSLMVFLGDGTTATVLEQRDDAFADQYWPTPTAVGDPAYYCIETATTYRVFPTPSAAFPYRFRYRQKLAALTSTNTTNFYTEKCYDALLAGCMVQAARFVQDDRQQTMLKFWGDQYQQQLKLINDEQRRRDRDDVQPDLVPQENE